MPSAQYSVSVAGLGNPITNISNRTGNGGSTLSVPIPIAIAGTLSTRTNAYSGVLTLPTGHGITTSNIIDIYWGVGSANRAYSCAVSAVTSTTVTFAGASSVSWSLPVVTTAVNVSPEVSIVFNLKPAESVFFACQQAYLVNSETASSHADFQDASGNELVSLDLGAGWPYVNDVFGGAATIFTGANPASVKVSNGSAANAATFNLVSIINPTV